MKKSNVRIRHLLVAIDPDVDSGDRENMRLNTNIVQTAASLARRMDASMRLLSVIEIGRLYDFLSASWFPKADWMGETFDSLLKKSQEERIESARQLLTELASSEFSQTSEEMINVVTARRAEDAILAEAAGLDDCMIVLGCGQKSENALLRTFSTPIGIMSQGNFPILVIGHNSNVFATNERCKLLIADDLRDETAGCIERALNWAIQIGNCDLHHLHVGELRKDDIMRILNRTIPELRSTVSSEKLTTDVFASLESAFIKRMNERLQSYQELLQKSGGSLSSELRRNPVVPREIQKTAAEFGADVIAFGQHERFHMKPYMIGRVTYYSMLNQNNITLIFPR